MKLVFSLLLLSSFFTGIVISQDTCQVLKSEISVSYTGACKDGLAQGVGEAFGIDHYKGEFKKGVPSGQGTYFWSTGEIYEGYWKNGLRNGKGKYTFFVNGKDATQEGRWVKDKYMGAEKVPAYLVTLRRNLDRYVFLRLGDGNSVYIYLYKLGTTNSDIENLMLSGDSGSLLHASGMIGFDQVDFPFEGKINYRTWNKLHTQQFNVVMEFRITKPGRWKITIHN